MDDHQYVCEYQLFVVKEGGFWYNNIYRTEDYRLFTRIKVGLFHPSQVAGLKNDKKMLTALYFLIMVLFSLIPFAILVSRNETLSYEDKRRIRTLFRGQEIPYEIVDHQLVKTSPSADDLIIALNPTFDLILAAGSDSAPAVAPNKSAIVFTSEKVYLVQLLHKKELFSYSEYQELKDIDLALAGADDSQFWDTVFPIVREQIDKMRTYNLFIQIVVYGLVFYAIELLIFSLILTVFLRIMIQTHPSLSFSGVWQLIIYLMAPYVVFRLFADLYGLHLLAYVGIIITIIYTIRMNNALETGKGV